MLLLSLALLFVGASLLVFYRLIFLHLVRVPTGAMANTIIPGDCLVVKKRAFGEISRGDIIVFSYPRDTSTKYIFRVVGLPREIVEVRGMSVYINGKELSEQRVMVTADSDAHVLQELSIEGSGPYRVYYSRREGDEEPEIPSGPEKTFGINAPYQIPDNEYFVMGDNRDNSYDSRFWGTVPRTLVFGKPTVIYFSSDRDNQGNENIRWERIFKKVGNN